MDGFLNLAKQGYSAYQDSQKKDADVKTGGQEYNQRPPSPPGAGYGSGQSSAPPGAGYGVQGGQEYNQPPAAPGAGYSSQGGQEYNQPPAASGAGYGGQDYNQPSAPTGAGYGGGQTYNQSSAPPGASYGKTGGQEYNQRAPSPDGPDFDDDDDKIAARASDHAGDAGDTSLFSQALSFAKGNKSQHKEPVNEAQAVDAHKVAYDENKPSNLDANSLGSAAALQVLKQFTSGSGSGGSGGSKSQSQLITLAMSEAAKLFDKGGAQSGNKQDAVNGAAMTVVKLLVQSKFGGGGTGDTNKPDFSALLGGGGGGGGGGGNQLLGLASSYFGKK